MKNESNVIGTVKFDEIPTAVVCPDVQTRFGVLQTSPTKKCFSNSIYANLGKYLLMAVFLSSIFIATSCGEDEKDTPFTLLTGPVWVSDSLLVNGLDASGVGQPLANFRGEARFLQDGTGIFAGFTGTWRFAQNDTRLIIESPDFPIPITTQVVELSRADLKISTEVPNPLLPGTNMRIRMTFKSRW